MHVGGVLGRSVGLGGRGGGGVVTDNNGNGTSDSISSVTLCYAVTILTTTLTLHHYITAPLHHSVISPRGDSSPLRDFITQWHSATTSLHHSGTSQLWHYTTQWLHHRDLTIVTSPSWPHHAVTSSLTSPLALVTLVYSPCCHTGLSLVLIFQLGYQLLDTDSTKLWFSLTACHCLLLTAWHWSWVVLSAPLPQFYSLSHSTQPIDDILDRHWSRVTIDDGIRRAI
jgi:hypothetical protein